MWKGDGRRVNSVSVEGEDALSGSVSSFSGVVSELLDRFKLLLESFCELKLTP